MEVTLIANTVMRYLPASVQDTPFAWKWVGEYGPKVDLLGEFAGRACYQSWDMPNPKTATTAGYMENIVEQQHFSILEHASATFYVEGVSRSLTHELIRHRHLSYSELSQRYVDVENAPMVMPPAYREVAEQEGVENGTEVFNTAPLFDDIREEYAWAVSDLEKRGYSRKAAREAARCLMPNATETKIVVSGNLRAWRDMLKKRWHVAADAEIREFAGKVLAHLREVAPASVHDIPDEPYAYN
jgi:thymidylate synthase (FAD)